MFVLNNVLTTCFAIALSSLLQVSYFHCNWGGFSVLDASCFEKQDGFTSPSSSTMLHQRRPASSLPQMFFTTQKSAERRRVTRMKVVMKEWRVIR